MKYILGVLRAIGSRESGEMLMSDIVGSVWWEAISRTDRVGSDESVVCVVEQDDRTIVSVG